MMGKWRESTWGEEISLEYGKALRGYENASGKFRVFGSNGPIGWTARPLAPGPGIILGRKGAYRGVEFSHTPFFVIDTAYYVVPKSELDMRWLYYAIKHHKLGEIDDGSPIPSTTRSAVYVRGIQVPPLAEQEAIAAVLGALDDKIELNRRMNATLEAMARALFQSWFVDFDPVRAKREGRQPVGLDPATAFPAAFQDSELGGIPIGWKTSALGDVLDVLETGRRPKGGVGGYTSGIPSVGAESIWGIGQFDYSKTRFVPREFYEKTSVGRVQHNDVLLYKDGGKPGEFRPRVGLFGHNFPFPAFSINEHVFRMRSELVGQPYLYFAVSDQRVLNDFANKGGKAAIPGINQVDVKSTRILLPSRGMLKAFNERVTPLCDLILRNSIQSRTLATLRDTLLPKLLSGELSLLPMHNELSDKPH